MNRHVAGWALAGGLVFAASAQDRMNVLFIVSDDLRVVPAGRSPVLTPNLDRLAARGVRFERAYAQYPVCNPSRSSFLTGLRCEQTGVVDNITRLRETMPDVVTMPQMLRPHGWYTAAYGKILHLGGGRDPDARARWMDLPASWDEALVFQTTPAGRVVEGRNLTGGTLSWCQWGATAGGDDDQPDGQNALHAIRAMETLTRENRPWFVGAGFHRPHDPFISPRRYFDLYPPDSLKLYRDPPDMTPLPPLSMTGVGFQRAFDAFTDAERLEFLRAYYTAVSFMDAQVGRLIDAMDRLKLWERTLVVFIGDNGYHHNERNWWNKNTLFERSCRVPMIVCAPDARAGSTATGLVEMVDLYPTVADYCGVALPHEPAGRSLRPLLKRPDGPGKPAAFTLVTRGGGAYGQSTRTDRWRYTLWSDGEDELYDHTADPEETRDVSGLPGNEAVVRHHRALIDALGPYVPARSK